MQGDPDYSHLAWFLGPKAENQDVVEQLFQEILEDVAANRRRLAREDPPMMDLASRLDPSYLSGRERLFEALRELLSRLREGTPFWSDRYLAHLNWDEHLAVVAAQVATLFYNPNIVVRESSPGVLDLEREVIQQVARMVGYDPTAAGGSLTSGGTLGNLEQMWRWRNMRYLPLALRAVPGLEMAAEDEWGLLNLSVEQTLDLATRAASRGQLGASAGTPGKGGCWAFSDHPGVILAPASAHYSIAKVSDLLGIGRNRVLPNPLTDDLRASPAEAARLLAELRARRIPVIALVLNLGSTEEGRVDPVDEFVELREECRRQGQDFPISVDAAIGGIVCAMFRDRDGRVMSPEEASAFWRDAALAPGVAAACQALGQVDGITLDPHKWQLVPYQAGIVMFKDRRVMMLTPSEDVPYLFRGDETPDFVAPFTVEGSRPGGRAAMVWMTQRVTPLTTDGEGRLVAASLRTARAFAAALDAIPPVERDGHRVRVRTLIDPDLCIVNWLCVPETSPTIAAANALNELVAGRYRYDGSIPVTAVDYVISSTSLDAGRYGEALRPIIQRMGLDDRDYPAPTDRLVILRSTLFHPHNIQHAIVGFVESLRKTLESWLELAPVVMAFPSGPPDGKPFPESGAARVKESQPEERVLGVVVPGHHEVTAR